MLLVHAIRQAWDGVIRPTALVVRREGLRREHVGPTTARARGDSVARHG